MKRKLLAVLITAMFSVPAVYAQGTTAPKDTGMTKDRPAAGGSASTSTKADAGMKGGAATGSASTSTKGEASAKADTKAKNGSPDAVITGKVKTGFIKDKIVRSRNYNVDTKDSVVTLKGKARSQAELDRAVEIAKNTQGVTSVKNEVQLMASTDQAGSPKAGSDKPMKGTSPKADTKAGASGSTKGSATTTK